ncbi:hypothetical protein EBBID32_7180 [Sphingobium indicum BiD32]|uniref:Uncharacterized protein n=1 Tax=Sphingobium indicum BiD32 TaxID=1301087 RepID=N1ML85_9SPHN|nr:hypothetical protein EBBID32_7180 [Sphingobium indicum BiD32]
MDVVGNHGLSSSWVALHAFPVHDYNERYYYRKPFHRLF